MKLKLYLLLVESSLELVPKDLWEHPSVLSDAKRRKKAPNEIILNISRHFYAMRRLNNLNKRGRPDIVHLSLLTALDSPLNKSNCLKIYIHTINGTVIRVNPKIRLPRNLDRFEGLMVQLFKKGHVPDKEPYLLEILDISLKKLINELKPEVVIGFSRLGRLINLRDFLSSLLTKKKEVAMVVGGFQRGHFSKEVTQVTDELISISKYPLSSHVTICKTLSLIEDILGIC